MNTGLNYTDINPHTNMHSLIYPGKFTKGNHCIVKDTRVVVFLELKSGSNVSNYIQWKKEYLQETRKEWVKTTFRKVFKTISWSGELLIVKPDEF